MHDFFFYHCSIRDQVQDPNEELRCCCKVCNLVIHGFDIKIARFLAGFFNLELYMWKLLNLKLSQPVTVFRPDSFIPAITEGGTHHLSCLNALLDFLK